MSLGGYKFYGVMCSNSYSSVADWTKCRHCARVKAFIEANNLARAGWTPQVDGNTAFETFGNILYNTGSNWVTIFVNGATSLAIVTLYSYQFVDTTAYNYTKVNNFKDYGVENYVYNSVIGSCYHVLVDNSTMTPLSALTGENQAGQTTRLVPVGMYNQVTTTSTLFSSANVISFEYSTVHINGVSFQPLYTYAKSRNNYYGYAIKGKSVISIANVNLNNNPQITILSTDAFSSLVTPNDTSKLLYMNLSGVKNVSTNYNEGLGFSDPGWSDIHEIYYDQNIYEELPTSVSRSRDADEYFDFAKLSPLPAQTGDTNLYSGFYMWTPAPLYTTNVSTKGPINIDLLSYNFRPSTPALKVGTVQNGIYLLAEQLTESSTSHWQPALYCNHVDTNYKHNIYVGWDSSNPIDLSVSSAWSIYQI
jgi:hypothetical protein